MFFSQKCREWKRSAWNSTKKSLFALFVRAIAERLLLRFTAATKFEISSTLEEISLGVNKISGPGKAQRSTFWVAVYLWI